MKAECLNANVNEIVIRHANSWRTVVVVGLSFIAQEVQKVLEGIMPTSVAKRMRNADAFTR